MSGASAEAYSPGLEGVIASETAIANIEGKTARGGLSTAATGSRIWRVTCRTRKRRSCCCMEICRIAPSFASSTVGCGRRGGYLGHWSSCIPEIPAPYPSMDVLRSSVSVLVHFDPDVNAPPTDHAANVRKAERMVAQMATAVAYRERISRGLPVIAPRDDLDHAANFFNMVNGKVPSKTMRATLLIFRWSCIPEHELNASTFAARVTVLTLSDIYSGIVAAVGTLKGPLHGGANEEAWKVLEKVGSPDNAEHWIKEALARKERIMGFGHRVYKTGDPRAAILKHYCIELACEVGDDRWERTAEPIEKAVTTQKLLPPTSTGRVPDSITIWIGALIFICPFSRWRVWPDGPLHIIEQLDHNRLNAPKRFMLGRRIGPSRRSKTANPTDHALGGVPTKRLGSREPYMTVSWAPRRCQSPPKVGGGLPTPPAGKADRLPGRIVTFGSFIVGTGVIPLSWPASALVNRRSCRRQPAWCGLGLLPPAGFGHLVARLAWRGQPAHGVLIDCFDPTLDRGVHVVAQEGQEPFDRHRPDAVQACFLDHGTDALVQHLLRDFNTGCFACCKYRVAASDRR